MADDNAAIASEASALLQEYTTVAQETVTLSGLVAALASAVQQAETEIATALASATADLGTLTAELAISAQAIAGQADKLVEDAASAGARLGQMAAAQDDANQSTGQQAQAATDGIKQLDKTVATADTQLQADATELDAAIGTEWTSLDGTFAAASSRIQQSEQAHQQRIANWQTAGQQAVATLNQQEQTCTTEVVTDWTDDVNDMQQSLDSELDELTKMGLMNPVKTMEVEAAKAINEEFVQLIDQAANSIDAALAQLMQEFFDTAGRSDAEEQILDDILDVLKDKFGIVETGHSVVDGIKSALENVGVL
jgi:hypothetical protein